MGYLNENLVIGWRCASGLKIEYFDNQGARTHGDQPDHALELVKPSHIAMHTAIVAQSGSGKSFFLGRYLEEVLLKTQAKVTIFDPNADFRRFKEINDEIFKSHSVDDSGRRILADGVTFNTTGEQRDPLPHEKSRAEFAHPWKSVSVRVLGGELSTPQAGLNPFRYYWPDIPATFLLLGEEGQIDRDEFKHIHTFIRYASYLWRWCLDKCDLKPRPDSSEVDVNAMLDATSTEALVSMMMKDKCRLPSAKKPQIQERAEQLQPFFDLAQRASTIEKKRYRRKFESMRTRLVATSQDLSEAIGESARVRVLDMPSFDDADEQDRDIATLSLLDWIWHSARSEWEKSTLDSVANGTRAPHLVVIDEAHNLASSEPPSSPLKREIRERLKTMAGEGRKYGIFLVLVTQRPDKVDRQVLSECGNQALMLIRSLEVLHDCKKMLGIALDERDYSEILNDFAAGYVRLSGKWSNRPRVVFAAARRTIPGGAGLTENWAKPSTEILQKFEESRLTKSVEVEQDVVEKPIATIRSS